MIDDVLKQLKNPDPEERKKAVVTLGRLRNRAALKPLEEVYRRDPDPDLRQLAYKVGRYIQYQSQVTNPIRGTVTEPDFLPDTSPWDVVFSAPATHQYRLRREWKRIRTERKILRRYLGIAALLMLIGAILFLLFQFHHLLPL
jgi:hypothetical protein